MQSFSTLDDPNVVGWRFENFAKFYEQSIEEDNVTSEVFAFEHPKFGEIEFFLQFKPKRAFSSKSTQLSIHIMNAPPNFAIPMKCVSWMETIDEKRSETITMDLSFKRDKKWDYLWCLASEHMYKFFQSTTALICCRLPYSVKLIGSISRKNTLYRWPITDFESRFNAAQLGTEWESAEFEVSEFKDVKFTVKFYPKGKPENKVLCFVYLHVKELAGHSKVSIQTQLWLENAKSRLEKTGFNHVFSTSEELRFPMYLSQAKLCKFAQEGPFVICCDVRAIIDPDPLTSISFRSKLASFFNDPFFSDAEIRVDNQVFKVSRAIVSSKSPVFCGMFGNKCIEQESGVVTIKGFEASIVEKMLVYIYKNEVIDLKESASELLRVADCYQVYSLVARCIKSIHANLGVNNLLDTLELAYELEHIQQFKYRVLKFAHRNGKEMIKLPGYKDLLTKIPKIAIDLLDMVYA